jgi:hypothetical protein
MKIRKISVLVLVSAVCFALYVSPYIALHNLFMSIKEEKISILNYFVEPVTVENNIYNRYSKTLFGNVDESTLDSNAIKSKRNMESSIKFGIDVIVEPENIAILVESLRTGKTPDGKKLHSSYEYEGLNRFVINFEVEGKAQQVVFSRRYLFTWIITDLVFPTELTAIQ